MVAMYPIIISTDKEREMEKAPIDIVWEKIRKIEIKHFKCKKCGLEFSVKTKEGFMKCQNTECNSIAPIPSDEWTELEAEYISKPSIPQGRIVK